MSRVNHVHHRRHTPVAETPSVDGDEGLSPLAEKKDGFEERPTNWSEADTSARVATGSPYGLTNRGGAVLDKPVVNNIYLGDYWKTAEGQKIISHNDAFAKDILKSSYMGILSQYGVGQGSFAGSTVVGGKPTKITEADVQKIVKQAIAAGGQSSDPQAVHTVILPPGCILSDGDATSQDGLGGYHGSYKGPDGNPVYYAVICYSQGNNGIDFDGKPADNITITESHEWSEAFTDPDVNSPIRGRKLGWYNDNYGEIGDEAIDVLPLSKTYGTVDGYVVQKEWSNKDRTFETTPKSTKVAGGGSRKHKTKTTIYG